LDDVLDRCLVWRQFRLGGDDVGRDRCREKLDTISSAGEWADSEFISGTISGSSISLSETRITYSGGIVGSCELNPALRYSVSISTTESMASSGW
jgi:hypothetical protein